MRYYSIVITDPTSGQTLVPDPTSRLFKKVASGANVWTYSSLVPGATVTTNGGTLAGALRVELDIPVVPFATPQGGSRVKIWGVSLAEIGQQAQLNGMNVAIYGGMAKGLPLAKPQQAGLLATGAVFQAFGNWTGVEMTLDLIVLPATGTDSAPKNIVINWKAGQLLADAIKQTLTTAFPTLTAPVINISPNLVLSNDEVGAYSSLSAAAQYIKQISLDIVGADYLGVDMAFGQNQILVYDATTRTTPKQLAFEDMIGQPTWIGPATVNVSFVMRNDLHVNDFVKFPTAQNGQPLTSPYILTSAPGAAPNAPSRNQSVFQGSFMITDVHHFGDSRQPDAAAWVTVVNMVVAPQLTGSVTVESLSS